MSRIEANGHEFLGALTLAALGVVYGDIGTSPLYAMRESLGGLPINLTDVLGVLSLIFWSLTLVISMKYLFLLFRADNDGEGGILALLALSKHTGTNRIRFFFVLGILGAGLMLGDGMLTPAISVMSAIEGVNVALPHLSSFVLPITCAILVALFAMQSLGTARIGKLFGPMILIWFVTIALVGVLQIINNPVVLKAVNPWYAIHFFQVNGWKGYVLLGGVFLVVTGGEALYADLGHFGKSPIRKSWFFVAFPSLVLNYFGQGAYLLKHPEAIDNPFYHSAPTWFMIPLLVIATCATIIASQAVISATFSMMRQAVLLGLYPHLSIIQTSDEKRGQIYVPQVNMILALGTLLLVLVFRHSSDMTHAYGIAVNLEGLLSLSLVAYVALRYWQWHVLKLLSVFLVFGVIDIAFLGANIQKLFTGAWIPVVFASISAFVMYTWNKGRVYLENNYYANKEEVSKTLRQFDYKSLTHLPNTTAIFITDIYDQSGATFLNFLKLNRTLPAHILLVKYQVEHIPYVSSVDRFEVNCLKENICELTLHYGFMDVVSIPQALYLANERGFLPFDVNVDKARYIIEIPNVLASRAQRTLWFFWQEKLFAFLVRNYAANFNIEFYQLPYDRTVAIGTYCLI
ncbi:MAG: KUP/HAK/KT family potassium transporter [Legionellaceae bacterium]|nr:KUP/HAK/KT family potassium transporter [Legionellaceae bacterium]